MAYVSIGWKVLAAVVLLFLAVATFELARDMVRYRCERTWANAGSLALAFLMLALCGRVIWLAV